MVLGASCMQVARRPDSSTRTRYALCNVVWACRRSATSYGKRDRSTTLELGAHTSADAKEWWFSHSGQIEMQVTTMLSCSNDAC